MSTNVSTVVNSSTRVLTRMYNFQGHEVRAVITRDDETLFCLSDVCECCELTNPANMAKAIRERFAGDESVMSMKSMDIKNGSMNYIDLKNGSMNFIHPSEEADTEGDRKTDTLVEAAESKEQESAQSPFLTAHLDALAKDLIYSSKAQQQSAFYACDEVNQKKGEFIKAYSVETAKGFQALLFITEPQLYFVMFRGRSDMAKAFSMWVCNEVLPSIRKHGYYHTSYHNLVALPELPQRNASGHYDTSYPQVLRQVQEYYQMDSHCLELMQWVVDRAIAQGYARAKTNERELAKEVQDLKEQLATASSETLGLAKAEREEWEGKYNEAWKLLDETQEELAKMKKHITLYKSVVRSLLEACSNAQTKELVEALIDCIF